MNNAIVIRNMKELDIDEVFGSIELPTSVYGNRSITLEVIKEWAGGSSSGVAPEQLQQEVDARIAGDNALGDRVTALESVDTTLKTINNTTLKGTGNISLPTSAQVTTTATTIANDKVAAYKFDVDAQVEGLSQNILAARDRTNHTGTQPFSTISGVAAVAQIPNLSASKITSGVLAIDRLPLTSVATTTANGFMSSADKVKLDGLSNVVTPVAAPTISITEPIDAAQVQSELQKIIDAIKSTGAFL